MPGWIESVREHREALEALAEHGQTQLAEDARVLLDDVDSRTEKEN